MQGSTTYAADAATNTKSRWHMPSAFSRNRSPKRDTPLAVATLVVPKGEDETVERRPHWLACIPCVRTRQPRVEILTAHVVELPAVILDKEILAGFRDVFPPSASDVQLKASYLALKSDLSETATTDIRGITTTIFEKLLNSPHLRKELPIVLAAMASVRDNYQETGSDPVRSGATLWPATQNYQVVNWHHCREEIADVVDMAQNLGLSSEQTADAVIVSAFSDAIKTPSNFILHHVDGAKFARQALSRVFPASNKASQKRMDGICASVQEHHIGPPQFMGTKMIERVLLPKTAPEGISEDDYPAIKRSIAEKISAPFSVKLDPLDINLETIMPSQWVIDFTDEEHRVLETIGIEDWYVPHRSTAQYLVSRAVIDADTKQNYTSCEGVKKIVAIRGPGTNFPEKDATVFDSVRSAADSYEDAMTVVSDQNKPLLQAAFEQTQDRIAVVHDLMKAWFLEEGLTAVPFYHRPLDYDHQEEVAVALRVKLKFCELLHREHVSPTY